MKTYGGVEAQFRELLISVLEVRKWSASRLSRLTPENNPPVTMVRRLGGPKDQNGRGGDEKYIPVSIGNGTPVVYSVA